MMRAVDLESCTLVVQPPAILLYNTAEVRNMLVGGPIFLIEL